ncbi:MAG: PAS domain S-box protein [bacterium]|nr:PAS domain S-box protein [bacterium]
MEENDKSKEQLIRELEDTRRRLAQIESEGSERQLMEAVLRESEERFRTIFDSSLDIILIIDAESRKFLGGNTVAQKVLGYSSQELRNLRVMDIHPKTDVPRVVELFEKMVRRETFAGENIPVQCKDGRVFSADLMSSVITLAGKQYLLGIFRDLTEIRRMEDKVKKTEEIYRNIIAHSQNYIYVNDINGYFLDASPALLTKVGLSLEKLQKLTFLDSFAGDNLAELLQTVERLKSGLAVQNLNVRAKTANGEVLEFEVNAVPLFEQGRAVTVLSMARDVTEQKKIQKALQESEENYRRLLEISEDMIFTVDLTGNFTFVNPALKKYLGYTREELMAMNGFDLIHPDDREMVLQAFLRVVEKRETDVREYRYLTKGGSYINISASASIIYGKDGNPVGILGIARNITDRIIAEEKLRQAYENLESRVAQRTLELTKANQGLQLEIAERKRAEDALRESETMYRTLVETSPDVIALLDMDGRIIDISKANSHALGLIVPEQLIGQNGFAFLTPDTQEDAQRFFLKFLEEGAISNVEYRVSLPDGKFLTLEVSAALIKDADGKPKNIIATAHDITEKIQAQEALRESEEMYKTLAETSSDAIATIDREGNLVSASPRALEMFGNLHLNEAIGKRIFDWVAPEYRDKAITIFQSALDRGFARDIELRFLRKDKTPFIGEINAAIIKDRQGQPQNLVVMIRDVTERKQMENLLYAQRDLGVALSATNNLDKALRLCLESAVQASGMDCGGIYLVDEKTGAVDLTHSQGLSPDFVRAISHYDASSPNAALVKAGKSVFFHHCDQVDIGLPFDKIRQSEGLRALAIIPIFFENRVIACLNISSHDSDDIPMMTRHVLVSISVQIGNAITRIKAENALRESEEKYRNLVEDIPDSVTILDLEGNCRFANQATEKVLGYPPEEAVGKNIADVTLPAYLSKSLEGLATAMQGKPIPYFESMIRRKDGTLVPVETGGQVLYRDGKVIGIQTVTRDITERKRAEENLRENERKLNAIINGSPIALFVINQDHQVIHWNKALETYSGIKAEEIIGTNQQWKAFYPEERPCLADLLVDKNIEELFRKYQGKIQTSKLIAGAYEAVDFFPSLGKEGIWLYFTAAVIEDHNGKIVGAVETLENITERKRAEEALRESEELYRTLVHTSPDAIIVTDLQGRVIEASQKNLELTGYQHTRELVGSDGFKGIAPEDREKAAKVYQKILKNGFARNVEYSLMRKDGSRFLGEVNATLLKDTEGNPQSILAVIRDITERKRLEKEILEVSTREQRRIGQDLHDGLSQHLTAISFMNKSLENKLAAKAPAEAKEAAKISQLVSQAITQTRSLARGLYPVEHKADGLISSLKQLTINLESMYKISCLFQCNKRILIEDNTISTNLYYIAKEATNNTIKHGKAKRIKIRLASMKNKLTLTVSDDGAGIPKNSKATGGMGLQIMEYRSKMIGASFNVQPGRKGGTLVTCSLHFPSALPKPIA